MTGDFNVHAFHRRRKFLKALGLILVIVGLFMFVDMVVRRPFPITGYRAVFAGVILLYFGFLFLYKGYKLPIEEAIDLILTRGRGITESELVLEMRVHRATAGRIIAALIRKGFLRSSGDTSSQTELVFEPVR